MKHTDVEIEAAIMSNLMQVVVHMGRIDSYFRVILRSLAVHILR